MQEIGPEACKKGQKIRKTARQNNILCGELYNNIKTFEFHMNAKQLGKISKFPNIQPWIPNGRTNDCINIKIIKIYIRIEIQEPALNLWKIYMPILREQLHP